MRLIEAPADADAHTGEAILAYRRNDTAPARAGFRRAVAIAPMNASYQVNVALVQSGAEATKPMKRALALAPDLADVHANLAVLGALPELEQVKWCRRALSIQPAHHAASINLGLALSTLGRPAEAIPFMTAAIVAAPLSVDALFTLAGLLADTGRLGGAAETLRRAAALAPGDAGVWLRFSRVSCSAGLLPPAATAADRVIALDSKSGPAYSNRLLVALYDGSVEATTLGQLARSRHRGRAPSARPVRARRVADHDALRIAYVSADFRNHPIAYNIAPVIAAHDRSRMHVSCYADVIWRDGMTDRIAASADRWTDTTGRDDRSVADAIARDDIDVLVLLGGHTANNRLGLARFRPAPLQFSLLDVASSGSPDIDAIILDPALGPPAIAGSFTEEQTFVSCLFCFSKPDEAPPTSRRGSSDPLVFGSFNNPSKIGPDVAALWSPLLQALPGSKLLLKYKNLYADDIVRSVTTTTFAAAGLNPDRLVFATDLDSRRSHLDHYRDIDIALDTVPFNGCTTTFEALWMGVPVLTATANRMMGRMGASILGTAGLSDLVAHDVATFTENGLGLAANAARRSELRTQLRDCLLRSRLIDGRPLARELEDLFEQAILRQRAA